MASKHCPGIPIITFWPIQTSSVSISIHQSIETREEQEQQNALNINDLNIASTELIKLLGVHIDDNPNLTAHISKLCTKASQKLGVRSRLRNLIPCKAKLLLYESFLLPFLTFCHLTRHFCESSDKRKLERMQERALKVIYNSHSHTYEQLVRHSDILPLYNSCFRISQSNMVLYLTAFPIYLFANVLHPRCGRVTSRYQVLELYAMANTLVDISGHSYSKNVPKIKEIRLVYLFL